MNRARVNLPCESWLAATRLSNAENANGMRDNRRCDLEVVDGRSVVIKWYNDVVMSTVSTGDLRRDDFRRVLRRKSRNQLHDSPRLRLTPPCKPCQPRLSSVECQRGLTSWPGRQRRDPLRP